MSDMKQPETSRPSRPLLEFGPLLLFFVTNYAAGIYVGTAVLVVATVIALALSWHLDRKIPLVPAVGCAAVVLFGSLTLITEDESIPPERAVHVFASLLRRNFSES